MTKFLDGPAEGVVLPLRRAPVMLRAVRSRNGTWDALDQPEDEPRTGETIFVYRLTAEPTYLHLSCSGKGGKRASGFYAMAEYRLLPEQPAEQETRTTAAWATWCDANRERLDLPRGGPKTDLSSARPGGGA